MNQASFTLVCFAVKEEAQPFKEFASSRPGLQLLLTGIGRQNAQRAFRRYLENSRPGLVISAGFAGGLNPELPTAGVVFSPDTDPSLKPALLAAGSREARFHCSDRIASTTEEKRKLREQTQADVVEMESQALCAICSELGIPRATVRVILDTALEDLPLDFNELMTPERTLNHAKLALALLKSPGKVGALRRLQQQSQLAAERLADTLQAILCR